MKRKLFITKTLNNLIAQGFMEEGHHISNEEELIEWFLSPDRKSVWGKLSDIEIMEHPERSEPINRQDLVIKIIKTLNLRRDQKAVLGHLNAVTNKTLHIPVIALNKSYSWTRLVEEVEKLTDTGKAFIKEMMENIEEMKSVIEKK
jgi:hypothetical protein